MENTKISWTDCTFNPWWGCDKVSPGCKNCYAESFAKRTGNSVWGKDADRRFFGDKRWRTPLKWNKEAAETGTKLMVFCGSMMDVFEDRDDLIKQRERLWKLIEDTPNLIWQLLTKRPENILDIIPLDWVKNIPKNVWYMTTCENQEQYNKRVVELAQVPAYVRGLSVEPMLGPIDLIPLLNPPLGEKGRNNHTERPIDFIDWVIVGGESGHGAREFNLKWARDLRNQCMDLGIAFFMKQLGNSPIEYYRGTKSIVPVASYKGDTIKEFPDDLKIQMFPKQIKDKK